MSQDLVIHLSGPDAFDWSVVERSSGQRVASGTAQFDALPEALPVEGVDRTLLLLPAERIFATRLELPARSEREARQAAPFMIEDELAARLDQTRIVTGSKDEDGKRWVFAAETAWIDGVMEALGTSLVRPVHILPDAMAASEADAALTLADRSGDVLFWFAPQVRDTAQSMGGAVDAGFFNHVAHALVAGAKGGEVVVSPALGLAGPGFKSITFDPLDLRASRWTNERLGLLPALGGDGWRSSLNWGELLRPIRRGAIMAAALAITLAGLMLAEGFYYRFQAERFDTASVAVFRNVVPEMTRRVIPAEAERLLRERIGGLGGGEASSFLQLTAALAELTDGNERVRIDHIRFDQSRGELRVSALYTDFADFDALSAEAERMGINLQDEGAREGDDGLQGEFLVRLQ